MESLPSGTVTFLFTDIESSTRRWEAHTEGMRSALARHDSILRHAILSHGGYVFKTMGDAFCAAFSSPPDALRAVLEAQAALHNEEWPPEIGQLRARAALHMGVADLQGGDYFGLPVNRVARILSAGHGGQTLLSLPVYELVRDSLPAGATLVDMGEHRLKDLTRPERLFQLNFPGLPSDFPSLRTLDNRPNNLPAQPTPFIGREHEVLEVCDLLRRPDSRLATLTGPGGTGKSRLALQVAAEMLDDFEHGAFFVNLAPIADPSLVISTVAQTLGVRETAGQPILDSLRQYLADKQLLLVLDNFEQVLDAAPRVSSIVQAAPGLKVLVTSRSALRLRGEKEHPVPPLSLPDPHHLPAVEKLSQYEAVRLFIERATDVKPDFQVTNDNAPAVAEICARLDGLPLAIELAAARIRLLTPQAMLARLQNRLKLLTGGARDLPARQQTLRSAIEWSYELLDDGEKQLFRRLAVFVGGRSLEAIEAVCNADGELQVDFLDGLESLISKSLLRQVEGVGGEPRFVMLETIHEFAREKLGESGEAQEIYRAHADYFLSLAELAEPQLTGRDQVAWLDRLEEEHDNFRAALRWAAQAGLHEAHITLAGALWRFWIVRGHFSEGYKWLEQSLVSVDDNPTPAIGRAAYGAGILAAAMGDYAVATRYYDKALDVCRRLDDRKMISWVLNDMGLVVEDQGQYDLAKHYWEESLALKRAVSESWDVAIALSNLGELARAQGEYEYATSLFEESLVLCRAGGERMALSHVLHNLGLLAAYRGDFGRAREAFKETLSLRRAIGDSRRIAESLLAYAALAVRESRPERAARLLGAGQALLDRLHAELDYPDRVELDRTLEAVRSELGAPMFASTESMGRQLDLEQAIAYALQEEEET